MKNRWSVETEKGDHSANAVWGAVEDVAGRKTTVVVLNTDSNAAAIILASGMFYLKGPGMVKPVLFRIQSSRRARIEGCMFVKAVEVADMVRMQENTILREMRDLLQLDMLETIDNSVSAAVIHTVAS